ncbi:MAG: tRNA pseudouridine(38-40) synthase TruA [Desulfofustis sp.]|jgi:tRNA pseudouridine38-40 synthase|nr:tRNA pseudouridine(38-40) synthase TruA [Desulfofustis sp.]
MRTIKLVIAYDGTGYCGWQRQTNGPSIQQEIERAASIICNRQITVHGAGRTDAGVHAVGMTAHFSIATTLSCRALHKGLNALLPEDIRILAAQDEATGFHARFSALAKTYRYTFFTGPVLCPLRRLTTYHLPYPVSLEAITVCLETICGTHDFSSFETTGSRDKSRTSGRGAIRTIFRATIEEADPGFFQLLITGDGFLRHMVRNLAGTLLEVGRDKRDADEFSAILQARDRNLAGATAPAHGLTLLKVHYRYDWQAVNGEGAETSVFRLSE